MSAGGTKKLTAKVTPKKNVYKKVVWTSSNKKVAAVTSKGVVKGLREGSAKITASAVDGSKKKASVTVKVGAGIASVSADVYKRQVPLRSAQVRGSPNLLRHSRLTNA